MKRIIVRLPLDVHERLRQQAARKGVSLSALIRGRLSIPERLSNPLAAVVGIVRDGNLAENLDAEIYGEYPSPPAKIVG